MWLGALLAAFISGPRPVARPLVAMVKPPARAAMQPAAEVVRKPDKSEASPLDRFLQGFPIAADVPVAIKPEFSHGAAAALSVKF